jgi:hypothetical protein
MKTEATKVETPKTLEQRISSMLSATDVTSTAVAGLIAEVEDQVSETSKQVELERAISNSDVSSCRGQPSDNRKRDIEKPLPLKPVCVTAQVADGIR